MQGTLSASIRYANANVGTQDPPQKMCNNASVFQADQQQQEPNVYLHTLAQITILFLQTVGRTIVHNFSKLDFHCRYALHSV